MDDPRNPQGDMVEAMVCSLLFVVVEIVSNDDGSNIKVAIMLLCASVGAIIGGFVQGNHNQVGF
jgi:hypothetical protein